MICLPLLCHKAKSQVMKCCSLNFYGCDSACDKGLNGVGVGLLWCAEKTEAAFLVCGTDYCMQPIDL